MNVDRLKSSTPILQSFVNNDKLHIVGGVYTLKTGKVTLI
jgi:carbonic anhydrase